MENCICPYYELDEALKKEAEAYIESMPDFNDFPQEDGQLDGLIQNCGPYCKHMKWSRGFPGEHLTICAAPGNEKILDSVFDRWDVI